MKRSEEGSRRVHIDRFSPDPLQIEAAAAVVREGGIVLYPTDTVYGLGCSALRDDALTKLFDLKQRSPDRGVLLLIPELAWVERCAHFVPGDFFPLAKALWPGPVTFLLPASPQLPDLIAGSQGKVGLRQPELPYLRSWIEAIGAPLVSSSANISGRPLPESVEALSALFGKRVDLFLESAEMGEAQASTVVDLCTEPAQILREGQLAEKVRSLLRGVQSSGRPTEPRTT